MTQDRTGWSATPTPVWIAGGLATIVVGAWMVWQMVGELVRASTAMGQTLMVIGVLLVMLGLWWLVAGIVRGVKARRNR